MLIRCGFHLYRNGFYGSAICAFGGEEIDTAFSGTFKEQQDTNSLWQPTPQDRIPDERPGSVSWSWLYAWSMCLIV